MHTGLGKPIQGQSSSELRDGSNESSGLAGVGASGAGSGNQMTDERVDERQRGLERESGHLAGKKFSTDVGADELPNETV